MNRSAKQSVASKTCVPRMSGDERRFAFERRDIVVQRVAYHRKHRRVEDFGDGVLHSGGNSDCDHRCIR